MKITIDTDELAEEIASGIRLMQGVYLSEATVIGEHNGVQVKLVVTRDEDDLEDVRDPSSLPVQISD